MSAETIYARLINAGLTPQGACGLMGNMQAESALRANNAQDGFTPYSDEEYTERVDANLFDFYHDSVGYGLCQWTYPSRKKELYLFALDRHVSIGDEAMQVDFCLHELEMHYQGLLNFLKSTDSLERATERVCKEYEQPQVNNIAQRLSFAKTLYNGLQGITEIATNITPTATSKAPTYWYDAKLPLLKRGMEHRSVEALQLLLSMPITGVMDDATVEAVKTYQRTVGEVDDGEVGIKTWKRFLGV